MIVEGGNSAEIGNVIYNNVPPGIPMKGSLTATITRPNGSTDTVNYDTSSPVNLYVEVSIKLISGAVDEDYIKQELSKTTFEIGQSAESANLTTIIKNIIGDAATPYDVGVSLTNSDYSEIVTPTGLNEFFTITAENIDITVVS